MSETDDTDELILIPPDLFASGEPFLDDSYFEVVDSLISQVNKLENRISWIECKSETGFTSSQSLMSSTVRKHRSSDDVTKPPRDAFESTQSTPQKPPARRVASTAFFAQRNLNFDEKNLVNVNTKDIDRNDVSADQNRSLERIYDHFSGNSLDLKDLEFMLKKIDEQQKTLDLIVEEKNVREDEKIIKPTLAPLISTNPETVPPESFFDESFEESSDSTQITALPTRLAAGSDYVTAGNVRNVNVRKKAACGSSTASAYPTYRSPQKRTVQRRLRSFVETDTTTTTKGSESSGTNVSERCEFNSYRPNDRFYEMTANVEASYARKLDEERMRRQRCEQVIQQLQKRAAELQDRLAAAVRIDEAKDDAILRFHKAWEQVAVRLQTLVNERNTLEQELKESQDTHANNLAEASEKLAKYENEIKKTYLIMQTTQEKNKEMEKLIIDLTNEIQRLNNKIESLEKELKINDDNCTELKGNLAKKDELIREGNATIANTRAELENERKRLEQYQMEFDRMKEDCAKFDVMVKERDGLIETLEKQNQKLLTDVDHHKKNEKDLQKELTKVKEFNEKEKLDLKYFYQEQVERVVKEKLLDFQVQLERARGELEDDLKKREVIVAKTAATHIQQIADKHSLEIRLLEEKHTEEVRLYQVQLSQAQQLIDNLQHKLQQQQMRKQHMAKQLHKLMEAQWLEALKIINNGRSPMADHDLANQLNLLKSKSYNNMEEVLGVNIEEGGQEGQNFPRNNHNPVGQAMYPMETPLTSRPRKQEAEEIQKYVQMLLQKQSASPTGDHAGRNVVINLPGGEHPPWQPQGQEEIRVKTKEKKVKPPWK